MFICNNNTKEYNYITGSKYNDILLGNKFNNYIIGGSGDDHIDSKGGYDTIYGGDGSDTFIISPSSKEVTIIDFELNNINEKIDLRAFGSKICSISDMDTTPIGEKDKDTEITIVLEAKIIDIILENVQADKLKEDNFIFHDHCPPEPECDNLIECCIEHPIICFLTVFGLVAATCASSYYVYNRVYLSSTHKAIEMVGGVQTKCEEDWVEKL